MRIVREHHARRKKNISYMMLSKALFFLCVGLLLYTFERAFSIQSPADFNTGHSSVQSRTEDNLPSGPAYGQQLSLDLNSIQGSSFKTEQHMKDATLKIAELTGFRIVDIQTSKTLRTQGISVVATLEDGHMTVQTWPEHGTALVDIIARGINIDLQEAVPIIARQYGGDLSKSVYSIKPRGDYKASVQEENDIAYNENNGELNIQDNKLHKQFEPFEIMGQHKYKQKVFQKQSPYQHIAIYDHYQNNDDALGTAPVTRSLFLDGVMQSSDHDEVKYHQALVHPAFIASSSPVKRVLIIGGGEGGTLREVLKWKSVENVTMVDLDADVIAASRAYLTSYSDCSGFGTANCFEDPRVEVFTENFVTWDLKYTGSDVCARAKQRKQELYDIVLIDLVDVEELPEDKEWAEYLYTTNFFQRIACSLNAFGVLVANFGEAPEFYNSGTNMSMIPKEERETISTHYTKIKQIQTMSQIFRQSRVYDVYMDSSASQMAFAIGIKPKMHWITSIKKALKDHGNKGINDFDGTPARVNLKLRRGLISNAYPLRFYDGAVQHSFQYPTADWVGIYCLNKRHQNICNIQKDVFTEDYEEEWFEPHLNPNADGRSGFVAKKNIKKGHVSGLWDAATALNIPSTDLERLKTFADGESPKYKELYNFLYIYGHDGGQGSTGSDFYCSFLSFHTFANHDCNHDPNFRDLYYEEEWSEELWQKWNPVGTRIMKELDHVTIASRDIAKGEMITDDYSHWDGFAHDKGEQLGVHAQFKEWCGEDYNPQEE